MGRLKTIFLLLGFFLSSLTAPVLADMDIEQIRQLVQEAKVLPLEQVIQVVAAEMPGRAIEVELEQKHGILIYEIEWLDEQGRVWDFRLDASTAEIIKQERD